jgi:hypothetical protein
MVGRGVADIRGEATLASANALHPSMNKIVACAAQCNTTHALAHGFNFHSNLTADLCDFAFTHGEGPSLLSGQNYIYFPTLLSSPSRTGLIASTITQVNNRQKSLLVSPRSIPRLPEKNDNDVQEQYMVFAFAYATSLSSYINANERERHFGAL